MLLANNIWKHPKVDTKSTMNKIKKKNKKKSWCIMPSHSKEKKKEKYEIKLKGVKLCYI